MVNCLEGRRVRVSVPRLVKIRLTTVRLWRIPLVLMAGRAEAAKKVRRWNILSSDVREGLVGGPRLGTWCMISWLGIRLDAPVESKVANGILVILVWETYVLADLL